MTTRPLPGEYVEFFAGYVSLVTESDILPVLEEQLESCAKAIEGIAPERETFRYAPGKWSIREVVGHLVDAERVFGYRAFCISRGERANLPSFDEVAYVEQSGYSGCSLRALFEELTDARRASLHFYTRLNEIEWKRQGTASNNPITVRALAFITVGHLRHHLLVLRDKYGVTPGR